MALIRDLGLQGMQMFLLLLLAPLLLGCSRCCARGSCGGAVPRRSRSIAT